MQLSQSVLKGYLNRLTNLSSRNRSLLLTSLPAEQFLDLHETDFLDNKPSFELIRQLIARRPAVPVCDVLDSRLERVNEVSRKLRKIARTERFIEEERGAKDLYVGYLFVRGKLSDGTVIHGPLIFFPVHLEQQATKWLLVRRADEPVTLNRSFLLAYAYYNGLRLPEEWLEQTLDELDKDATVFRTQLYELLKESPFEINFNPELFTDRLHWFNKMKKSDLETLERKGELKLYPEAVLGIFPQAGSYLVPDYEALIGQQADISHPDGLSLFFPPPSETPPTIREENLHTPLLMDASQEEAVRQVKAGKSLVVQGPPGTGKSQLIGNLMADFAAQGKRVLLVCQKRAALDVVYERLRQVGMQPFSALIHDVKNDRKSLYEQIAGQIERIDEYRRQNHSLDAILLERTFDQESRRIDQALAELNAFKEALFDDTLAGVSVKQLYLSSDPAAPSIPLDDLFRDFRPDATDEFARQLQGYRAYQTRLGPDHPWHDRLSFADFSFSRLPERRQTLKELPARLQAFKDELYRLTGQSYSYAQVQAVAEQTWPLNALLALLETSDDTHPGTADLRWRWVLSLHRRRDHPLHRREPAAWESLEQELEDSLGGAGVESSVPSLELPPLLRQLREADEAQSSLLRRTAWNWFSKDKTALLALASANGMKLTAETLPILLEKVQRRIRFELARQEAEQWLNELPEPTTLNLKNALQRLQLARQATDAARRLDDFPFLDGLPESSRSSAAVFAETVRRLTDQAQSAVSFISSLKSFLSESQLERLWREPALADELAEALSRDIDLLIEADRLYESFTATGQVVLRRLGADLPVEAFLNGLRLAWIDHIEAQHPVLRGVSSLKIGQLEEALQESVRKKQDLSQQILLVKLRERTYKNLTFNRLNNLVTYRELAHQVTKKRNVWPARKLMEQFADEVFQLVPCWMASPESISAIFPMVGKLFDLVIFDEASQCFAENGIPAIYRARQVVITGDSKQLQPSDLYRIRFETEPGEDTPLELEVESLLDLATHYLAQTRLRGHYRSRSIDLIDFSNRIFYKNSLHLLPDFHQLNRREPAIRYLNVKGSWQNNTNETEARAVVDLIAQLRTELPGHSIGVVTFNFPQQQLIQELLEEGSEGAPAMQPAGRSGEGLFVKNIENVQGDERDIIIFSIGYAPDARGRLSVQFGSLNGKGGENRLNVAVTRARERVYVVTSLWPQQLAVEQTANPGPKLLKSYLEYALSVADESYRPQPRRLEQVPGGRLLKDQLADPSRGLVEELPFADLTQKSGEQYTGLILTDDELYYESSVKEAHATVPHTLHLKNWPFRRIYSREYWRGRLTDQPTRDDTH